MLRLLGSALIALAMVSAAALASGADRPPNVVLIITDDQGYGDLGVHGNTMIQTPHLDRLAKQSVRLTNFHCDPTCAETRSALMTGRYSCRTGVWHTIAGRSIMRNDEVTMGDVFAHNGYATGQFGKWHLGDHYPYRPEDRGFQEVLRHGGGGVGQVPDHWGNDYFDDTCQRFSSAPNGKRGPSHEPGYCTDVWFRAATQFIDDHREQPFFCYIAANAPHDPYYVDEKYSRPYIERGVPPAMARFYGMITNIDENVGRLLMRLDEWKLADNTIVIFMTDNGTSAGAAVGRDAAPNATWRGFAAGMRAQKGSQYDGGHRVPCFIRWPGGKLAHGSEVAELAAHFDLLPTLKDLCALKSPRDIQHDGTSLRALLADPNANWKERTLVVHSQRMEHPQPWHKTAVMTNRWRLVDGKELYDITVDPAQKRNVAAEHAEVVQTLTKFYDEWWRDVSQRFDEYVRIPLGAEQAPSVELNCHDWHTDAIAFQVWVKNNRLANGWWAVEVATPGKYRITLRDRPSGVQHPLTAVKAALAIGDVNSMQEVPANSHEVVFETELPVGPTKLETTLTDAAGKSRGAYFVTVERLSAAR